MELNKLGRQKLDRQNFMQWEGGRWRREELVG